MNLPALKSNKFLLRKLATVVFVTASLASFATLGDGGDRRRNSVPVSQLNSKNFSLRTNFRPNAFGQTFRKGNFIVMNTVVTYQKGNATYIMTLKKKVLLNKITFSPSQNRF